MSRTIEQACQDEISHLQKIRSNDRILERCKESFYAGAEFMQKEYEEKLRWIPTIEQTPTATEIGDWDGKRSDFVLAKTKNGSHYILRVYEGFSNGEKWVDWADKNDMIHTGIVEWRSFL